MPEEESNLTKPRPVLGNPPRIFATSVVVETAGKVVQLPNLKLQYDTDVLIKAKKGNGGDIYVSGEESEAESIFRSFPLDASEEVKVKVNNLDAIWINADTDGDGINLIVEIE